MFKTQNFCHIASNNRNQVKVGVFVYRTTDSLATVSASGYFNERIIDLKLHDIIIHEQIDASDATKVKQNFLCVVERTLTNVKVKIMDTDEVDGANTDLNNLTVAGKANISRLGTYNPSATYATYTVGAAIQGKVNIDGSSIMTGPLKFRAGSFVGAIAGGLGDGISIYKLKSDDSIDSEVASLTKENGFTPGTTNAQDIGSSSLKWKDAYISRVITGVLNNGANINVPTVAGTLARVEDINSKITDCVTNIPQDIKLEISSNVITLKAGSKAYLPDGTTYTATHDIVLDNSQFGTATGDWVLAMTDANTIFPRNFANCVSGAGATTVAGYAFNTTTNKIHWFSGGGVEQAADCSFPIAVFHTVNGVPTVIKQIFNGYGFIGSTIFVLPGVTCFGAAGRNTDGTVKNYVFTTSQVITNTPSTTNGTIECVIRDNQIQEPSGLVWPINKTAEITNPNPAWYYCLEDNICGVWTPSTQTWSQIGRCVFATVTLSSGKITEFKSKTAFHAVDYNDTDFIAHQAMPGNSYVDLTLVSTGGTYTALADGYFTISKAATASGQYINFVNNTNGLNVNSIAAGAMNCRLTIPVSRGDTITVNYTAAGTTNIFRFVYANGHE